jgi:hypothetical protein
MSKVRICVEWRFKELTTQFRLVNFKVAQKIFKSPVAKHYITGVFLQNLQTCFYGNQTSQYFRVLPMSIYDYIGLVNLDDVVNNLDDGVTNDLDDGASNNLDDGASNNSDNVASNNLDNGVTNNLDNGVTNLDDE